MRARGKGKDANGATRGKSQDLQQLLNFCGTNMSELRNTLPNLRHLMLHFLNQDPGASAAPATAAVAALPPAPPAAVAP